MPPFGPILRAAVSFSMTESMIRSLSASEPNALAMAGARKWTCAEARALDVAGAGGAGCLQCPLPYATRAEESTAILMPTGATAISFDS